jgi:hypothetical protein
MRTPSFFFGMLLNCCFSLSRDKCSVLLTEQKEKCKLLLAHHAINCIHYQIPQKNTATDVFMNTTANILKVELIGSGIPTVQLICSEIVSGATFPA